MTIEIVKVIFRYMWCGRFQPIRRSTLCLSTRRGGVDVQNMFYKSLGILGVTSMRELLNLDGVKIL